VVVVEVVRVERAAWVVAYEGGARFSAERAVNSTGGVLCCATSVVDETGEREPSGQRRLSRSGSCHQDWRQLWTPFRNFFRNRERRAKRRDVTPPPPASAASFWASFSPHFGAQAPVGWQFGFGRSRSSSSSDGRIRSATQESRAELPRGPHVPIPEGHPRLARGPRVPSPDGDTSSSPPTGTTRATPAPAPAAS